ncbi:MAG: ABC transporter substrate-binding protein [Desulfobacterota bacterium]|nr:ABC transporter substrate-binding protein [Thermodesulfobacteriota bacterium]
MNRLFRIFLHLPLLIAFAMAEIAFSGEPQDQLRQTTDKVLTLLADPSLKSPEKARERREAILKTIDERFDWEEMARRTLARHWTARTPEERQEFIRLFKDLLERVYMDKVEGYSWNRILYEGEQIEGNFATVRVKIFTSKDQTLQVDYRMRKRDGQWLVYDFIVEGVGLVNNYRTQFNDIIVKSSYQELVRRLKSKTLGN